MKTILITGGAGYIGSHTVVELLNNPEYNVIIVDNFSNSNPEIVNRLFEITKRPIKVYHRDCREQMDDILSVHKVDGIIHFAAYKSVGESVESPIQYYDNNINSLLNMVDTANYFGIKNFVFSSSCSLYGNVSPGNLPVREDTPLSNPESPYAYTKLIGERILSDVYNSNKDLNIISLRYFNPVGAHSSGLIGESPMNKPNNIIPVICDSIVSSEQVTVFGGDYPTRDGTCIRDYVHVSDIANAHVLAIDKMISGKLKGFETFNLGSETGVSVLELIKRFEQVNRVSINHQVGDRRIGDVVEIYSDSSKAKKELEWQIERNLDDIVSSAWKWYNNRIIK